MPAPAWLVCCDVFQEPKHDGAFGFHCCARLTRGKSCLSVRCRCHQARLRWCFLRQPSLSWTTPQPIPIPTWCSMLARLGLRLGTGPKRSKCCSMPLREGPPRGLAHSVGRERDGPDAIQGTDAVVCPSGSTRGCDGHVARSGRVGGPLLSAAGVLWGLRRPDLAGLTLVAALVVAIPLFSRLPIPGAIAASDLIHLKAQVMVTPELPTRLSEAW